MPDQPITLAVITGGHAHDVPSFQRLFRSLVGVGCNRPYLPGKISQQKAIASTTPLTFLASTP